jgi:1,5-anhydro-D-fructose reductase (1,5-anhydro-D-mannitol-forming)
VGFLLAGASQVAAQYMLAAIREQPPLPNTRDTAGAWVAALYSHNERRARDFAQRHAIIHFSDNLDDLLQRPQVQCVYVASHPRHHAETVEAALRAQKHVLCEPPLALSSAEAQQIFQMAHNRGLVLAMNHTWRAARAIYALHELLAADTIGEVIGGRVQNTAYLPVERQGWRLRGAGNGVLLDRTLRDVDLLRYLLHASPRELFGRATRTSTAVAPQRPPAGEPLGEPPEKPAVEELVGSVLFTGGAVFQLHDSFVQPHVPVTVELYGANGMAAAVDCAPTGQFPQLTLRRGDQVRELPVATVNPYRAVVANFLAAVRGDAAVLAPAEEEIRNLQAIEALEVSLAQGTPARVAAGDQRTGGLYASTPPPLPPSSSHAHVRLCGTPTCPLYAIA